MSPSVTLQIVISGEALMAFGAGEGLFQGMGAVVGAEVVKSVERFTTTTPRTYEKTRRSTGHGMSTTSMNIHRPAQIYSIHGSILSKRSVGRRVKTQASHTFGWIKHILTSSLGHRWEVEGTFKKFPEILISLTLRTVKLTQRKGANRVATISRVAVIGVNSLLSWFIQNYPCHDRIWLSHIH